MAQSRAWTLQRLRAEIAAIEKRPMLAEGARLVRQDGRALAFTAPAGLVHEVFSDDIRDAGTALGFALGAARGLVTSRRPAILFLQLVAEGQETGLPFGPGLTHFGLRPETLVVVRTGHLTELLWAMEEALGCPAVAAVVADLAKAHKGLDFTVSRRLSLRAAASGASALLVRYGRAREASAAHLRWRVVPASSGPPRFDARAPGLARFHLTLEKGRIAEGRAGDGWLLDWTEHGFTPIADSGAEPGARGAPAAHGAQFAGLGHRLPQTG
jgi:protein ImuA